MISKLVITTCSIKNCFRPPFPSNICINVKSIVGIISSVGRSDRYYIFKQRISGKIYMKLLETSTNTLHNLVYNSWTRVCSLPTGHSIIVCGTMVHTKMTQMLSSLMLFKYLRWLKLISQSINVLAFLTIVNYATNHCINIRCPLHN